MAPSREVIAAQAKAKEKRRQAASFSAKVAQAVKRRLKRKELIDQPE